MGIWVHPVTSASFPVSLLVRLPFHPVCRASLAHSIVLMLTASTDSSWTFLFRLVAEGKKSIEGAAPTMIESESTPFSSKWKAVKNAAWTGNLGNERLTAPSLW